MAYKRRRNTYRRRKRRATAWYNKKYSVSQLASKAYNIAKTVAGVVNTEHKTFDFTIAGGTQMTPSGTIYPLSLVAQGDDYNNRQGNSIRAKKLSWRIIMNGEGENNAQFNRIIIFQDTECQGSLPLVTDLLEQASVVAPLYHAQHYRFKVLKDYFFDTSNDSANAKSSKVFEETISVDSHLKYQNVGGVIASAKENQYFALFITDGPSNPNFGAYFRMRFIDN